ncbi:MAG: hypothetical protein M3O46_17820, partial [Myxococcota bacterium]|nr:hypothetical protein [Myxococcota bacterium]
LCAPASCVEGLPERGGTAGYVVAMRRAFRAFDKTPGATSAVTYMAPGAVGGRNFARSQGWSAPPHPHEVCIQGELGVSLGGLCASA